MKHALVTDTLPQHPSDVYAGLKARNTGLYKLRTDWFPRMSSGNDPKHRTVFGKEGYLYYELSGYDMWPRSSPKEIHPRFARPHITAGETNRIGFEKC